MSNDNREQIWRLVAAGVGLLLGAVGYLIEQRMMSMEQELVTLHEQVARNAAVSEANREVLRHLKGGSP
jgi:hypothetical protein